MERRGVMKIVQITGLSVNKNVFSYHIVAHRTRTQPDTGQLVASGPAFVFAYQDADGDSKFETLFTGRGSESETSDAGVPDWVLKNRRASIKSTPEIKYHNRINEKPKNNSHKEAQKSQKLLNRKRHFVLFGPSAWPSVFIQYRR